MQKGFDMRRFLFVLVLIIMALLVAEVLSGSTPITMPALLIVDLLIYGPGALLIRELVRRRGRGWISLLLLGGAYGLIEEGLALQSLFHPTYASATLWGARLLGVNWVYAGLVIIWIHPIWSAAIPVLLTELLFPAQRSRPVLGRWGLIGTGIWYILGVLLLGFFTRSTYTYTVSPALYGIVLLIVLLLTIVALYVLPRQENQGKRSRSVPIPSGIALFAGISAFIGLSVPALLWRVMPAIAQFPLVLIPLLLPPLIALVLFRVVRQWREAVAWNDRHLLALISGLLIAHTVVGWLLFSKTVERGISIGVMGLIMVIVLLVLARHVKRRAQAASDTTTVHPTLKLSKGEF